MADADSPTVDSAPPAEERPELARGTSLGRYVILDMLGEGGMGVVYKAYDPELDRAIALKVLHTQDPTGMQRDRLLREAQALARLQHPNVIAVHDVGTLGADVFIAMEYVEGLTVSRWLREAPRTWREILDVFLAAGEGLGAAHRAGLVHRDFKPDNVMVSSDGRVRVLDFGLARAAHAEAEPMSPSAPLGESHITPKLLSAPLTRVGATIGTPQFMSPEQHLGQATDESADQFSFCVSLHWALYGVLPFPGNTLGELRAHMLEGHIIDAPADQAVPRWLRQVIVHGLAVQATGRFESMAALLLALRADPRARMQRLVRYSAVAALALGLVGAVWAALSAQSARRAVAEQARFAQQFGQEVERIAAISRFAAFLPLHDTRREMSTIQTRMELLRTRMRELGPLAAGPGHQALGRGYLALAKYEDAARELEASWATGYRGPELAYALGFVHGQLYQRALTELQKSNDPKRDAARRAEIEREHRDPALRWLKEAEARESTGQLVGGVEAPEYVEGLIALYEERYEQALEKARKATERVPWLFEARTLEGDIHRLAAKARFWKGDVDGTLEELRLAGESYRAAVAMAHSSAAAHLGDCRRLLETIWIQLDRSQSPEATIKESLEACGAAAAARPDDSEPLAGQARAWRALAGWKVEHGGDPSDAYEAAIRLGEQSLALDPENSGAHLTMGRVYTDFAKYRMRRGGDPRSVFDKAAVHGDRALALDPTFFAGYILMCRMHYWRGDYEATHGIDPRPSLTAAVKYGHKAVELAPQDLDAWNSLGASHVTRAGWEIDFGHDPTAALTQAAAAFQKVVETSPKLDYGYVNLCEVNDTWGEYLSQKGEDPRPRLEQAIASCNQAIGLDPNYSGTHTNLGVANLELSRWALEHNADPTETLQKARAAFERALAIDRKDPSTFQRLGELHLVEARRMAAHGDPQPAFGAAETALRQALALRGGKSADSLYALAELRRRRAEWRITRKLAIGSDVRDGLELIARALEQNAQFALGDAEEGALHLVAARSAHGAAERIAAAERARAALDKALATNANLAHEFGPLRAEADRLAQK